MFHRIPGASSLLLLILAMTTPPATAAPGDQAEVRVRTYLASAEGDEVPLHLDLPFLRTTRWDLTGLPVTEHLEEHVSRIADGIVLERFRLDPGQGETRVRVAGVRLHAAGPLPTTYLGQPALPEESPALDELGHTASFTYDDGSGSLRIEARTLARGWLHTPAGSFIASLRREEVLREGDGEIRLQEVRLRWVSPRIGTVALARILEGAMRASGAQVIPEVGRLSVDSLSVLAERPAEDLQGMRIYYHETNAPPGQRYSVTYDQGVNSTAVINSLTPEDTPTMGDLLALDEWDFSGNTIETPVFTTVVIPSAGETCNYNQCGYLNAKADTMTRADRDVDGTTWDRTNSVYWDDGNDGSDGGPANPDRITVWLLAGAQHEGVSSGGDDGEGRFCYDQDEGHVPVPGTIFGHQDGTGYYYTPGDTWGSDKFGCDQNIWDQCCGVNDNPIGDDTLHSDDCRLDDQYFEGRMMNDVIKAGTVILPSGHHFNVVLVRTRASLCNYLTNFFCGLDGSGASQTNKYVVLFNAPHLDAVARLDSRRDAVDATSYTLLEEAHIGIGLYPPVSISVAGAPAGSVQLAWNPGNDTSYIDRHKIYWGPASGTYDHNSDDHPEQVAFDGNSATITGLTDGVPYYFTVTSLDTYANPGPPPPPPPGGTLAGDPIEYESVLFPTVVTGDPDFAYPMEVGAIPGAGCFPTVEAGGLTLVETGSQVEFCWQEASAYCMTGFELLASDDPTSDTGWSSLADPGPATCWTGDPDPGYYLVVTDGPGGWGPWGHYER